MDKNKLKKLIEENLGTAKFPEEVRDEILSLLAENCLKRASLSILEALSQAERKQFEDLASSGSYEEAFSFASSHIENFESLVQSEIKKEIDKFKERSGLS